MISLGHFVATQYEYEHETADGLIDLRITRWVNDDGEVYWSAHGFDCRGLPPDETGEHFAITRDAPSMEHAVAAVNIAVAKLPPKPRIRLVGGRHA